VLAVVFILTALAGSLTYGARNPGLDQVTRLKSLCKVWGLLKYYHPEVAKGEMDWDAVLIAAIPVVKAAPDYDSFNREIGKLIIEAGGVSNDYNAGVPAHPNEALFKWLKDKTIFSSENRKKLHTLQMKHKPAENFYVQAVPQSGNASFENEKRYDFPFYPDENYRLLALFRFWNAIEYFFPYKSIMDRDWDGVLEEYIPRLIEAGDVYEYHLTMREMAAHIDDGHGYCGSPVLSSYAGYRFAPFEVRYVEGKTIVKRVFPGLLASPDDVKVGDIVLACKGMDIGPFRQLWSKWINASNEPARQRGICEYVVRGSTGQLAYTFLREGQTRDVTVTGYSFFTIYRAKLEADALLDKWKILPGNIGYVHMGILEKGDVDQAMNELMNTRAIIFDMRYTPKSTKHDIAHYLNPTPVPFVTFTVPDLEYPGEFYWDGPFDATWEENPDYYRGRVLILVDEYTQSSAEYSCMVLQTAPDATVTGSQTAGADGDTSIIDLPGRIYIYFSGLGVYYPDGTPTQRIGIVPDINIRPTVTGIQAGKDEVLERAISFIENNQ
jgi:C-terminal processing protease CtpA/Prc